MQLEEIVKFTATLQDFNIFHEVKKRLKINVVNETI